MFCTRDLVSILTIMAPDMPTNGRTTVKLNERGVALCWVPRYGKQRLTVKLGIPTPVTLMLPTATTYPDYFGHNAGKPDQL